MSGVIQPTLNVIAEAPRTTGELYVFCEQGRRLMHKGADLLTYDAIDLRAALQQIGLPGQNPWLLGLDSKLAARRVTRHMLRAAAALDEGAKEMRRTWIEFQQIYLNTKPRGGRPGRRQFVVQDHRR